MNRSSHQYARFSENGVLCVNVLGAEQEHVSRVFSGQARNTIEERFEQTCYERLTTGAPVVAESLVSFDCEVERIEEVGTHGVFICRVVQIGAGSQTGGLLYFNRQYHRLTGPETRHESATARVG